MNTDRKNQILDLVHEKLASSGAVESARKNFAQGGTPQQQRINAAQPTQPVGVVPNPAKGQSSSAAISRFHKNTAKDLVVSGVDAGLRAKGLRTGQVGPVTQIGGQQNKVTPPSQPRTSTSQLAKSY